MSKLHICYGIDDNYADLCLMSIHQIILHKNEDTELDFLILGDRLTKTDKFLKFNSIDKVSVKIKQLNAGAFIQDKDNKPNWYITGANRMRVIIPHLPEYKDVDRVLYLDADTFILKDLTDFFNVDLGRSFLGICKNPVRIVQGYRVMQTFDYMDRCHVLNSGVMLFDNKKCREFEFTKKCVRKMRQGGNSNEHVISQMFYNDVKQLPPIFNCTFTMLTEPFPYIKNIDIWNLYFGTHYKSIEDMINQTYVIHFIGNIDYVLTNHHNKQIWDNVVQRTNKFFETGILDKSFITDANYFIEHLK